MKKGKHSLTAEAAAFQRAVHLVLDYWTHALDASWRSRALLTGVRFAVALQREPMLSFFQPSELEQAVQALGYEVLENLSP